MTDWALNRAARQESSKAAEQHMHAEFRRNERCFSKDNSQNTYKSTSVSVNLLRKYYEEKYITPDFENLRNENLVDNLLPVVDYRYRR